MWVVSIITTSYTGLLEIQKDFSRETTTYLWPGLRFSVVLGNLLFNGNAPDSNAYYSTAAALRRLIQSFPGPCL